MFGTTQIFCSIIRVLPILVRLFDCSNLSLIAELKDVDLCAILQMIIPGYLYGPLPS